MPQPELRCPFCEQTSSRSQGLASHIRSGHAKQYPKWLKMPTRLTDAVKGTAPKSAKSPIVKQSSTKQVTVKRAAAKEVLELPVESRAQVEVPVPSAPAVAANPALELLKQAHTQLVERRQNITKYRS